MNDHEIEEVADQPGTAEPAEPGELGSLLRSAREERELSVEDLAHRLRLEPRIMKALEREDFDRLPPPAFVRGYLRAIAKEYGVDCAIFLTVFDRRAGNEEPELSDFKSRAPLQMTSESQLVRYTTVAVVLLLVAMVALWWRAHDSLPAPHEFLAGTAPAEPDELPSAAFPSVSPSISALPPAADHSGTDYALPLDVPGAAMVAPGSETSMDDGAGAAPLPPVPADGATESAAQASEEASAEAAVAEPGAEAELVISTREEAWIDVSDANGRRLFFDIARPGRDLRFDGASPYTLVVGNSPVVTVRYRGAPVELAPHSREGVARLTLGR